MFPLIISQFILFAKYNYNNQIKEEKMGMTCSTHVCAAGCKWNTPRGTYLHIDLDGEKEYLRNVGL
jgi:translation elongation factor EF-Tu-like GTPase